MKRGYPPVWLGILILTLVVFWRMAGAPVTVEEFGTMETPFWQMPRPDGADPALVVFRPGGTGQ